VGVVRHICLLGLCGGLLQLQVVLAQQPHIRLDFRRANNFTYSTTADMTYGFQTDRYRFDLQIHHDNILNTTRESNPFVQSFLHTSLWQHYQLRDALSLASWLEYDHFINNQNYRISGYAGVSYTPYPFLTLTPLIGYSWDYRSSILDQGFSPALLAKSQYQWEDGLIMETTLFARDKYIYPRNQRNISLQSTFAKSFEDYADVAFQLRAGTSEIDDYRNGMIENIISDTLNPVLSLRYQLRPGMYWDSENSLSITNRTFAFDPIENQPVSRNDLAFRQLNIFSRQKLSFAQTKWSAFLLYEYQYLNRRYELTNTLDLNSNRFEQLLTREKQKDFFRSLTNLEAQVTYRVHPQHTLRFIANNNYIKYDTPSEDNLDDHDELTYGTQLNWNAQWSPDFSTGYSLLGNIRQYAFLFGERSQDNYTQYTLRMEFDYRWQAMDNLSMRGKQYIYVTYNIKDFSDLNLTDRSTRNLESHLEVNYRPTPKWETTTTLFRRETHVSYINWDRFAETTLDTAITYNISHIHALQLKTPWENLRVFLDVGYQHLSLVRKFNTAMTNIENILEPINLTTRNFQTGPRTGLRIFHRNPASIDFTVWWQLQYQDNIFSTISSFSTLGITYREENLRKINRKFRPFFDIKFNFWLRNLRPTQPR